MPPEKHAKLGPSGAHRWLNCTPSANQELEFADRSTEAAAEGTAGLGIGTHSQWPIRDGPGPVRRWHQLCN